MSDAGTRRPGWRFVLLSLALGVTLSGCDSPNRPESRAEPVEHEASATSSLSDPRPEKTSVEPAPPGSTSRDAGNSPLEPTNEVRPDDWFEDVTDRTGIRFEYRNGREGGRFYILESIGGGGALLDFDLDGDVDLFVNGGGTMSAPPSPVRIAGLPAGLFRNDGELQFTNITAPSGFEQPGDYSHGAAVTDYDGDGFPDLFVCAYGRSRLYRNLGDGRFVEAAGPDELPAQGSGTTAVWADIDGDRLPDLFLAYYVDWTPEQDVPCYDKQGIRDVCNTFTPTVAQVFRNRGDGAFEDWSARVGLKGDVRGLGLLAADFNDDGWVDFYLANDQMANHLYWGSAAGTFVEGAWEAGVAGNELGFEEGSMGLDTGDYDNDGLLDIWVSSFEGEDNSLYHNSGNGLFQHRTVATGLAGVSRMQVKWGTAFADFDGDGWLDIVLVNGHTNYTNSQTKYKQRAQLFRNRDGKRFQEISDVGGNYFREAYAGRGLILGDLDDDGATDFVAVNVNEPLRVVRNRRTPGNYLRVSLHGTRGASDAIGARVTVQGDGFPPATRFVVRGSGYCSHGDERILFPISGDAMGVDVVVQWPRREREIFRGLMVRKTQHLVEGRGEPYVRDTVR
ncbi:MAG: CRTAC1 family protein [Planctomycetaceae bacterium]|nr:CRTAC1 family protein [Planctomycetaceae bacterium]